MKTILSIFSIIIILAACSGNAGDKKAELEKLKKEQAALKEKINRIEAELALSDTSEDKSKLVGVTEMKPQVFSHFIEVQAAVEGDEDVMLSAESSGSVTDVLVRAGDKVSVGQLLATIDDKIIRQSISELQSQLDLSVQLYNRQKNLWDQKIGSEVQFLQAKTNKESMENRMQVMKEQLNMTRIKSPINGTVDNVNIKVGQTVSPGYPAIRVVNLTSLKVKGEVAESFITRIRKGNEVILYFPDSKKEIHTRLDYAGNRIDPVNRSFNVELRLPPNGGDYRPNMICVLKIVDYSNPAAFVVPIEAVQKATDGEYVFISSEAGNKPVVKRKTVKTGMIYNGLTEILSGLEAGDKVITNGYQNVIEGDLIRI
jgi:RND family efflux transporter MFP subunit